MNTPAFPFPSKRVNKNRIVKSCSCFPGWLDVPLLDWLESMIDSKVILATTNDCECLGLKYKNISKHSSDFLSYASFGVGRLALDVLGQ